MIKVGIIGATGYAGSELINILLNHKDVELTYLGSHSYAGKKLTDIYPFYPVTESCNFVSFFFHFLVTSKRICNDVIDQAILPSFYFITHFICR